MKSLFFVDFVAFTNRKSNRSLICMCECTFIHTNLYIFDVLVFFCSPFFAYGLLLKIIKFTWIENAIHWNMQIFTQFFNKIILLPLLLNFLLFSIKFPILLAFMSSLTRLWFVVVCPSPCLFYFVIVHEVSPLFAFRRVC